MPISKDKMTLKKHNNVCGWNVEGKSFNSITCSPTEIKTWQRYKPFPQSSKKCFGLIWALMDQLYMSKCQPNLNTENFSLTKKAFNPSERAPGGIVCASLAGGGGVFRHFFFQMSYIRICLWQFTSFIGYNFFFHFYNKSHLGVHLVYLHSNSSCHSHSGLTNVEFVFFPKDRQHPLSVCRPSAASCKTWFCHCALHSTVLMIHFTAKMPRAA